MIRENSATINVRPHFDTSALVKNASSLNSCLDIGPNMIKLVPYLLNRFRKLVALLSHIEKTFFRSESKKKTENV